MENNEMGIRGRLKEIDNQASPTVRFIKNDKGKWNP